MASDTDQWRQWLARHGPALVLFARQWALCDADAEDAVQEGFVRFWQADDRVRRPVAYLYACVRSAAIDQFRSRGSQQRRIDEVAKTQSFSSRFVSDSTGLSEEVEAALVRLPAEQREVVVMKIWGGLTFAEIAAALKISPNTAASRYRYAIERLEAIIAPEIHRQPSSEP